MIREKKTMQGKHISIFYMDCIEKFVEPAQSGEGYKPEPFYAFISKDVRPPVLFCLHHRSAHRVNYIALYIYAVQKM